MQVDVRCPLSRRERARVRALNWLPYAFRCQGRTWHVPHHGFAHLTIFLLGFALLVGCGPSEPAAPAPQASAPEPAAETPPLPPPPPPTPPPAAPQTVLKKAEMGVGEKGRGYGTGPVATPVAAYFAAKERIAFDIQIPSAMNLFKATEGRMPKSHQEFMEKIIKPNQIQLPKLPEGHRYVYDPKQGQLMVERPAP